MKTEFEKKLKELGFSYQWHSDDFYILTRNEDAGRKIKVQLISAEPVLEVLRMSHNGNKLEAIGSFKLKLMDMARGNDIFIFVFENTINQCVEFIIISSKFHGLGLKEIFVDIGKMFFSAFLAAFVSYFSMKLLDGLIFDTSRTINVFFLLLTVALIHFVLYLFLSWLFNLKEIYLLTSLILKLKEYQKKFTEIYIQYE